jgi:hypothetical protein
VVYHIRSILVYQIGYTLLLFERLFQLRLSTFSFYPNCMRILYTAASAFSTIRSSFAFFSSFSSTVIDSIIVLIMLAGGIGVDKLVALQLAHRHTAKSVVLISPDAPIPPVDDVVADFSHSLM